MTFPSPFSLSFYMLCRSRLAMLVRSLLSTRLAGCVINHFFTRYSICLCPFEYCHLLELYVKCAALYRTFIPQSRCGRPRGRKFHLTRSLVALEHGRATSGPRARSGPRRHSVRPATLLGNNIALRPAIPQQTNAGFMSEITHRVNVRTKDPATRNDFVNDIVNDAGGFHRRRWNSTIVTISSKLDMLTFDRR